MPKNTETLFSQKKKNWKRYVHTTAGGRILELQFFSDMFTLNWATSDIL
jgi:hypothetical protein